MDVSEDVRIGLSGPGFRGESPWPRNADVSIEFKGQIVQEYQGGETLHGLAKRHGISRNLVRIWAEAGEFDDDPRPWADRSTGKHLGALSSASTRINTSQANRPAS